MRAFQIEGWLEGKKIRRSWWDKASHAYYLNNNWHYADEDEDRLFNFNMVHELFLKDDWEVYEEPRKKRKVTLYRAICEYSHTGEIFLGEWRSCKQPETLTAANTIGHQEREIEVDCDQ